VVFLPGTGEVLAGTEASGLYRSTDGGRTWSWHDTALPRGTGRNVHRLVVSPDFAGDGTLVAAATSGVWLSRDRGRTWSRTTGPAPAESLAISPAFARDGTLIAAGQISTDHGGSWAPMPAVGFAWSAAAISPRFETDRTMWVAQQASPEDKPDYMVYRSEDAGLTWLPVEVPGLRQLRVFDIEPVAVAADAVRVFAGTERGVLVSQDSGKTWPRPSGAPVRAARDVASQVLQIPFTTGVIAAAAETGLAWSANRGVDWSTAPRAIVDVRAAAVSGDGKTLLGVLPVGITRFDHVLGPAVVR